MLCDCGRPADQGAECRECEMAGLVRDFAMICGTMAFLFVLAFALGGFQW